MSDNIKTLEYYLQCPKESVVKSVISSPDSEDVIEKVIPTMYQKKSQIEDRPLSKRISDSNVKYISGEEINFTPLLVKVTGDTATSARNKIQRHLMNSRLDFHSPTANTFLGYCFKDTSFATFKLQLVAVSLNEADQLYLRCFRYEGDASVLKEFFDSLADNCGWSEDEDDEDFDFEFDESDEEIDIEFIENLKYLNLQHDELYILSMVDSLKNNSADNRIINRAENTKNLLTIWFNTYKDSNLSLLAKYSSDILEAVMQIMKNPEASLCEIYGCCLVLNRLKRKFKSLKSSDLQVIVECLVKWSNAGGQSYTWCTPVPVSNNIQLQCAILLQDLADHKSGINMKALQKVLDHANTTKDVTSALSKVVHRVQLEVR